MGLLCIKGVLDPVHIMVLVARPALNQECVKTHGMLR
jgi:hypothetical protein